MNKYLKYALYLFVIAWFSFANAGAYEDFFSAVNRDDDRTVAQLLARGFDPNSRDPKGQTGLILALRDGSPRVAEALWTSPQLDVNAENASAENALMMAARYGAEASVDLLLARGASAAATNERNLDAIDMARNAGRDYLVERLAKSVKR